MSRVLSNTAFAALVLSSLGLAACAPAESTQSGDTSTATDPGAKTADVTFKAGPFTVASGADETWCTYVRADSGSEQDITSFLTEQTKGGHHLIVYTIDHPVDLAPHRCSQGGQPM